MSKNWSLPFVALAGAGLGSWVAGRASQPRLHVSQSSQDEFEVSAGCERLGDCVPSVACITVGRSGPGAAFVIQRDKPCTVMPPPCPTLSPSLISAALALVAWASLVLLRLRRQGRSA